MKKTITHYYKCLCCGNVEGYILKGPNVNTGLTERDIYSMIGRSMEPDNRVRSEWCDHCNMITKQEEVGWDYIPRKKATPPTKEG